MDNEIVNSQIFYGAMKKIWRVMFSVMVVKDGFIVTVPSGIIDANIGARLRPHVLIHGGTKSLPIVPICNAVKVTQVINVVILCSSII